VLETLTPYLLSLTGREARRRMAAQVSLPQVALLAALPGSQRELGERLRKDPADMVRLIDAAEADGLVVRELDPHDRRRRVVTATDAGGRALAEALTTAREVEAELLAPLSAAERHTLHELLLRLPR
jgi:MarR family transcriptional regulator, lower aerobic nicotinate degradation pathway regulator